MDITHSMTVLLKGEELSASAHFFLMLTADDRCKVDPFGTIPRVVSKPTASTSLKSFLCWPS